VLAGRPIIAALALLLLLLMGGCSAVRLAYNQAPELAYWWLDGYFDFSDEQTPRVRDALGQWFVWHRRTQLPDYAALLARAQTDVQGDLTPERLCGWWSDLRERLENGVERGVPMAADLMLSLSPAQIAHIERRYAKSNSDFRDEYLAKDPKLRLEASVKRVIERAELLYGRLDDTQRERVARLVTESPFDPELWLSERQRRQQDALQMLRRASAERGARDAAEAALRAYAQRVVRSPRESYRQYSQRLEQFNCSFAAVVHNSTSAAQRQAAVAKLKGWEADVRTLAANGVP
jgi:hypothetical protein